MKEPPRPTESSEKQVTPLTGSSLKARTLFRSPYYRKSYDFPWNPDPLAEGHTYRIYDEMKGDEQIKAVLSIKKDFAIGTGWSIECEDEDVRDKVTKLLENINETMPMDTSLDDVLRDMLSSYDYGFSISEPVYEIKRVQGELVYTYKTISTRPPHGFRFERDDQGNVTMVKQATDRGELELDPKILLHHVYQQEFGNPFGLSDLFSAHAPWKAKKFVSRFMAMYLERFASPTVVGKFKNGMSPEEVSQFHNMLKTIQQNTTLTIPQDCVVDFVQNARDASDAYIKALDYFNLQIARGVLVPDLLGISGQQTSGGAYSLGKKHFELFMGTVEKDRKSLSRKFTMKIVRPLVLANWGDIPCTFKFNPFSSEDMAEYMKIWISAVTATKLKPNDEEINHLRKQTGFPEGPVEIQEPLPALGLDGKPIPRPGGAPGKMGEEEDEKKNKAAAGKEKQEKEAEEKVNSLREGGILIFRQLTAFELKVDFVSVKRTLETTEKNAIPDLLRAAREIYSDFIAQVRDKGVIRRRNIAGLDLIEPKHLKGMNAVFKSHFRDLYREAVSQARREIPGSEKKFVSEDILPEEFLKILDEETFKTVGDYAAQIGRKGKNLVVQGIKDGVPEGELVKLLRDEVEAETERWLGTVVRTKTTEIYNDARKLYWDNDPLASQIVEAYQYSSIIDERTSDVCSELDGQIFEKGGFADRVTPPLHFNCRSVLVPITKFEDYRNNQNFIPAGKEPGLESLRDLGGNLIVG